MGDVDHQLRHQVSRVENMVVQLDQSLTVVGNQVAVVGQEQHETRTELAALRQDFYNFVRQAELAANIQRAETRVGALQGQVEHEFGHYKVVRRTAVGMLQAFDIGLVSQDSVRSVGEQLMVQTPRYWLAPVLVALAAWAGDDQGLCERAVLEAFRRSPGKTALFMALVLRRQDRHTSAVRWLKHYLAAQDPLRLGRDFAVILESISQGAFGPAGLELMRGYLDRWQEQLLGDETVQDAQVKRWRSEVNTHVAAPADANFPRLAAVSPQWPQLRQALSAAEAHASLIAKYGAMLVEESAPTERIEDAIDDILDRLVWEYDNEELPLQRELSFNEAVIRHAGDLEPAKRDAATTAALETTLDYLTIQSESALNPAAIGVSRSTQRMAVGACHEWFARAHAAFTRDYRMAMPPDVTATFGSAHNTGAQAFQLPPWSGSFTSPMHELEQSLAEHWDRHGQPYIDAFAYDWRKKAILPGVAVLGALLILSFCLGWGAALLLSLLGAGIWAIILYSKYQTAQKQQAQARDYIARSKHDSITQLRAAGAELVDWNTRFATADRREADVRTMIADLAMAGNAVSPYERRVVAPHGEAHR